MSILILYHTTVRSATIYGIRGQFLPRLKVGESLAQFIESLLFKHLSEFGGIDFMPPYQREYVWTDSDKEQLLDSIFMGSDIGKFTVRVLDDVE